MCLKAAIIEEDGYILRCADEEIYEKVKEAFEKQIPKKATKRQCVPNGWLTYGHCPNCDSFTRNTLKYCGNCGQALDWSDTE